MKSSIIVGILGAALLFANIGQVDAVHNILDYGALANRSGDDFEAAATNGAAFYLAVMAAHSAPPGTDDRTVLIPSDNIFVYVPHANFDGLYNVTIVLNGILNFFEGNMTLWPTDGVNPLQGINIQHSSYITLTGNGQGKVQGNGLRWWWGNILQTFKKRRPNMLSMHSCLYTVFENWHMYNSPRYHVDWSDMKHGLIQHCTIEVDIDGQRELLQHAGHWSTPSALSGGKIAGDGDHIGFPTFPLNTDGFDISGSNVTVRYCHVENFDDALCAKPLSRGSNLSHCTTDLHFHDCTITNGIGASVGSVGPSPDVNCIANMSFKRISFKNPLKAIYVKPNPCGEPGKESGIIDNILYEDIYADTPLWWSIWVSTQQQAQPGSGANTGCSFLYPIPGYKCETFSCVPVTNLKLRNVYMENALLSPGILRCNEKGPCTGWEWTNVTIKSRQNWPVGSNNFLCQAIEGANFTDVNVGCTDKVTEPTAFDAIASGQQKKLLSGESSLRVQRGN